MKRAGNTFYCRQSVHIVEEYIETKAKNGPFRGQARHAWPGIAQHCQGCHQAAPWRSVPPHRPPNPNPGPASPLPPPCHTPATSLHICLVNSSGQTSRPAIPVFFFQWLATNPPPLAHSPSNPSSFLRSGMRALSGGYHRRHLADAHCHGGVGLGAAPARHRQRKPHPFLYLYTPERRTAPHIWMHVMLRQCGWVTDHCLATGDSLHGHCSFFAKIDLSSCFWSIRSPMRWKRIFRVCTPEGCYHWLVQPFGWKYSPIICQRLLSALACQGLRGLRALVSVYLGRPLSVLVRFLMLNK